MKPCYMIRNFSRRFFRGSKTGAMSDWKVNCLVWSQEAVGFFKSPQIGHTVDGNPATSWHVKKPIYIYILWRVQDTCNI